MAPKIRLDSPSRLAGTLSGAALLLAAACATPTAPAARPESSPSPAAAPVAAAPEPETPPSPASASPAPATSASPAAAAVSSLPTGILGLQVMEVDGKIRRLGGDSDAVAVVFLGVGCPISSRAIAELNELAGRHPSSRLALVGVVSDPTISRPAAREFVTERAIKFPLVLDTLGILAEHFKPDCVPEAYLLRRDGSLAYRGLVDDNFKRVGVPNPLSEHFYLAEAVASVLEGKPVATPRTQAVGCAFESWGPGTIPAQVTYTREVAPLLDMNCVPCHHQGGAAPFPLTTYEQAAKRARMLAEVTESKLMPPWHVDPDYGGPFMNELHLSEREVGVLAAWAKAGAPRGAAEELPPVPVFSTQWQNGEPDLVVDLPPYDVPAQGDDLFPHLVVPVAIPEDRILVGFEFQAGDPALHHTSLSLDNEGKALGHCDPGGGPFVMDPEDKQNWADWIELNNRSNDNKIGSWIPGQISELLQPGTGRTMKKGCALIFSNHYHPTGKSATVHSRVGLYFGKQPITKVATALGLDDVTLKIPAGDPHFVNTYDWFSVPVPVSVVGITCHMHFWGRQMKVSARTLSGDVIPLLWVQDYDPYWEQQYRPLNPRQLPAGSTIVVESVYDNSPANPRQAFNPPKALSNGPNSDQEMQLCLIEFAVDADRAEDVERNAKQMTELRLKKSRAKLAALLERSQSTRAAAAAKREEASKLLAAALAANDEAEQLQRDADRDATNYRYNVFWEPFDTAAERTQELGSWRTIEEQRTKLDRGCLELLKAWATRDAAVVQALHNRAKQLKIGAKSWGRTSPKATLLETQLGDFVERVASEREALAAEYKAQAAAAEARAAKRSEELARRFATVEAEPHGAPPQK